MKQREFIKGRYVIALAGEATAPSWLRTLPVGVYRLDFDLCCDSFKTCSHYGKAIPTTGVHYSTGNIFDGRAFDTIEEAAVIERLIR